MQSLLAFFYLLDKCYDKCPENNLGGFLGVISPELLENGLPMDMAIYNDWKYMNDGHLVGPADIVEVSCCFLKSYEEKYGLFFQKTRGVLRDIADETMIQEAFRYAKKIQREKGDLHEIE